MSDTQPLQQSMAALKRHARCDQDVVDWFIAHPETLPDVPLSYMSTLTIRLANRPYLQFTSGGEQLVRGLEIDYRSVVAKPAALDTFVALTGARDVKIRDDDQPHFRRVIEMNLAIEEWPYACALGAMAVLTEHDAPFMEVRNHMFKATWPSIFPHIPWETMEACYHAGVTPTEAHAFVDWIMAAPAKEKSDVSLPLDLLS